MPIIRSFRPLKPALFIVFIFFFAFPMLGQTSYTVSFPNPNGHLAKVVATFSGTFSKDAVVLLPVWTPGSYLIRDYAKNVEQFEAHDAAGNALATSKANKSGWSVAHGGKPFSVSYVVYLNELAVRNGHVDASHAFFTPATLLVYIQQLMGQEHKVTIEPLPNWTSISTALPALLGTAGTFVAKDYDQLADSPFEIGSHKEQAFLADGVAYRIAMYNANKPFSAAQLDSMKRVVMAANSIFLKDAAGKMVGTMPIKEYLFIVHQTPQGGGGLEHGASSVLQARIDFTEDGDEFFNFLSLVAHEYFHLWNVKRIKPKQLGPFNYQEENYSTALWFAEGFTSYYEELILNRAGLMTPEVAIANMAATYNNIANSVGARYHTLEQASQEAWIKFYKPNENSQNATTSYYTQGSYVALATELYIRSKTGGTKCLDDLMRSFWASAQANTAFYVDRETFGTALSSLLAGSATEAEVRAWMAGAVASTTLPDVLGLAKACGIATADANASKATTTPFAGMGSTWQQDKIMVTNVRRAGPAEAAGLSFQDVIFTIDDSPVRSPFDATAYKVGQELRIGFVRFGRPRTTTLRLGGLPYVAYTFAVPTKASKPLKGWLMK